MRIQLDSFTLDCFIGILIAAGGLHGGKECVRGTSNTWEYFHFYHTKWWQLVSSLW
jgi:hypothetical protein